MVLGLLACDFFLLNNIQKSCWQGEDETKKVVEG